MRSLEDLRAENEWLRRAVALSCATPPPPPAEAPDGLLTITEACRRVGVGRRTIYDWIEKGLIEVTRVPSGRPRIAEADLLRRMT